jgi:hypothetical protein
MLPLLVLIDVAEPRWKFHWQLFSFGLSMPCDVTPDVRLLYSLPLDNGYEQIIMVITGFVCL